MASNGNDKLLPTRIALVAWEEHHDLRLLRRHAGELAAQYRLKPGEALLVSGSPYRGARRFQFVVNTTAGAMVLAPQTGEQNLLLSLYMRVAEAAREYFGR